MILHQLRIAGLTACLTAVAQPLYAPQRTAEAEEKAPLPSSAAAPSGAAEGPKTPAHPGPAAPRGWVYWKTVRAEVTAYDPRACCCPGTSDGRTSLGDNAWTLDGVAADSRAVPYRTRVWIPGAGWREVDDTGSAMRRSWRHGRTHIDLRLATHAEARRWGAQRLEVHLYRPACDRPADGR